jgi:hypothetical protein
VTAPFNSALQPGQCNSDIVSSCLFYGLSNMLTNIPRAEPDAACEDPARWCSWGCLAAAVEPGGVNRIIGVRGDGTPPQVKQRVFHSRETLAKVLILNGLLKLA